MGRAYRLGKRAEAVGETRQRIIEAARELLLQPGASATSIDDVAKSAGVTRATIYQHFGSRGDLLIEIAKDALARADASRLLAALESPDAREALRLAMIEGCRVWAAERATFSQIGSLAAVDPAIAELNETQERIRGAYIEVLITRLDQQGMLREGLSRDRAALLLEAATRFEAFDHLYTRRKLGLAKATAVLTEVVEQSLVTGAPVREAVGATL